LRTTVGAWTHYLLSMHTAKAGSWAGSALQCRGVRHQGQLSETELSE